MIKHKSFVPSDFSLRDVPGFLIGYIVFSVVFVLLGITVQALPLFWRGVLCGVGIGFVCAYVLLFEKKELDIANFPEPSDDVRSMCDDPSRSLIDAVKLYCNETGVSLMTGKAVLDAYVSQKESGS